MSYETGHIKRDPVTGQVALRTIFPEDQGEQLANMAWLVATKNTGARNAPTAAVESWEDLFVATPELVELPVDPAPPEEPIVLEEEEEEEELLPE